MLPKLYPLVTEKSWKSLLLEDGRMLLSTHPYKSEDAFLEKWGKKNMFRKEKEVAVDSISSFAHPERNPKRLRMVSDGKKLFIDFATVAGLEEVAAWLQEQRQLTPVTQNVPALRAVSPSLTGLAVVALLTWVIYQDAAVLAAGGTIEITGRRAGAKRFFAWIAGGLGPKGTLAAGGALALLCLFFLMKALRTPPQEVVYE